MPKKRFSAEQIVTMLRQIEVSMAQGKAAPIACRDAGISQQSYYRWRKEYGGLEIDQAVNRRALVPPSVSIKSDTCGADRRRDPTLKHRIASSLQAWDMMDLRPKHFV